MEWHVVGYCLIHIEAFARLPQRQLVCKMFMKSKGCKDCQLRSCCDLAERNARLWQQGKATRERFDQLAKYLSSTCEIAATYQDWLLKNSELLPLRGGRWYHRAKEKTKKRCRSA